VFVFAVGLALRLCLVLRWPAIHGGDSVARLAHSDRLVLAYQLPLPQLLVFVTRAVAPDPFWTRLVFATLGSLVPLALALALPPACGRVTAWTAALLLALHPLFVYYSIVPYQEGLMVLLLLAGVAALQRQHPGWASALIGLACLCRYEAWIAAALVVAFGPGRFRVRLLLFAWAPLLWIAVWQGLSPAGTYVFDLEPQPDRLARVGFLWAKLREYSGTAVIVAAALGAAIAVVRRARPLYWGAAYVAAFILLVIAAGHEFPPGSGRVSERLIHVPVVAVCALAGLALAGLWDVARPRSTPTIAVLLAMAVLAAVGRRWWLRSEQLVAAANEEPSLVLAAEVARFVDPHLPHSGRLAVAAPPVPREAIEAYVRKVARSGGDETRAREIAEELAARSVDAERIAAHLARPPGTVIPAGTGAAELLAVYDDAPSSLPSAIGSPLARFTRGPRGVTIYGTIDSGF
jgi:hypothetical protein